MTHNARRGVLSGLAPLLLLTAVYACGSSDGGSGGSPSGSSCDEDSDCSSKNCVADKCEAVPGPNGSGDGPPGSSCDSGSDCRSGSCVADECTDDGEPSGGRSGAPNGSGGDGDSGGPNGSGGSTSGGTNGSGGSGGAGTPTGSVGTTGPHFPGSGNGFRPLTPGCGPETATQCTGTCEQQGGVPTTVVRPPATLCFAGDGDPTPDDPAVVIEQVIERKGNEAYVHIRVTFDPAFTDNTFGAGSCCGWPERRGHRFSDLTGSDHTELLLTNAAGETVMNFKVDLVTADANSQCGFATQGVTGGDGSVIVGNAEDVLAVATSLDRNLNGCGYCENTACGPSGDCTVDSPATDESYTPHPETPSWDYRQVYEVWVALDAFGSDGFGQGYVTYTHSSPAKGQDTLTVEPTPCPPTWDTPYCPPNVIQEGGNCFGTPPPGGGGNGAGGQSGSGGNNTGGSSTGGSNTGGSNTGGGGGGAPCQPNFQLYVTTEGAAICTPIPFSNYPGMAPCPTGYSLDLASEGQYCVPVGR